MLILDSGRSNLFEARRATAVYLRRECPWVDADDVLLVVSELVTNAARHTEGDWRLRVDATGKALIAEVDDSGDLLPVARVPGPGAEGGFGWNIVRTLAAAVTIKLHEHGKTIQAMWRPQVLPSRSEFSRSTAAAAEEHPTSWGEPPLWHQR